MDISLGWSKKYQMAGHNASPFRRFQWGGRFKGLLNRLLDTIHTMTTHGYNHVRSKLSNIVPVEYETHLFFA